MFGIKRNRTDDLFSDIVRERANWTCQRCNGNFENEKHIFDCAHFISRGNKRLRWDFENASAICRGCHKYFEKNPDDHAEFVRVMLGDDRYQLLRLRKFRYWDSSKIDEKEIRAGLKLEWDKMQKDKKLKILGSSLS